jgi:predicted GNAT family acetyltransferase
MAGKNRPTKNGMTVSYVYTPPVYRGKGYASALVAQLSREILLEKTYASLYTDIQNPTSNKIYQLIGYEPVGDSTIFFY